MERGSKLQYNSGRVASRNLWGDANELRRAPPSQSVQSHCESPAGLDRSDGWRSVSEVGVRSGQWEARLHDSPDRRPKSAREGAWKRPQCSIESSPRSASSTASCAAFRPSFCSVSPAFGIYLRISLHASITEVILLKQAAATVRHRLPAVWCDGTAPRPVPHAAFPSQTACITVRTGLGATTSGTLR